MLTQRSHHQSLTAAWEDQRSNHLLSSQKKPLGYNYMWWLILLHIFVFQKYIYWTEQLNRKSWTFLNGTSIINKIWSQYMGHHISISFAISTFCTLKRMVQLQLHRESCHFLWLRDGEIVKELPAEGGEAGDGHLCRRQFLHSLRTKVRVGFSCLKGPDNRENDPPPPPPPPLFYWEWVENK